MRCRLRGRILSTRCLSVLLALCLALSMLLLAFPPGNPPPLSYTFSLLSAATIRRLQNRMQFTQSGIHSMICDTLIYHNITSKSRLQIFQSLSPNRTTSKAPVGQTKDSPECARWRRERGFERWPVTPEEAEFPLAFTMRIHRDPDMFARLLSVLWRPQNLYCVHVDGKSPQDVYDQIFSISQCFDNVLLTKTRIKIMYASINILYAELECVKLFLQSPVPWKYEITITGQEFPLKTNLEMVQILSALNGNNDIENDTPSGYHQKFYKFKAVVVNEVNQKGQIPKPPFKHNFTMSKGSSYNCLSRQFWDWVLREKVHQEFLVWLNDTWAPEEFFFATLGRRPESPGGPRAAVRHSHGEVLSKAVIWIWDPPPCHGFYFRGVCVFSALDLPWLLTRHELIANKFDISKDSTVLDCLERELERRALTGFSEWLRSASKDPALSGELDYKVGHDREVVAVWLQALGQSWAGHRWGWGGGGQRWPRLSNLNWTLYLSLPQFPGADQRG